jgi:hypothetical protein
MAQDAGSNHYDLEKSSPEAKNKNNEKPRVNNAKDANQNIASREKNSMIRLDQATKICNSDAGKDKAVSTVKACADTTKKNISEVNVAKDREVGATKNSLALNVNRNVNRMDC